MGIVGGGCAGVLTAIHLLTVDRRPRHLVICEPRAELGAGAAYGTNHAAHLLNVPAGSMSVDDRRPDDFVRWLAAHGTGLGPDDFAARYLYRHYLGDALRRALRTSCPGTTVSWVRSEVRDIEIDADEPGSPTVLLFADADADADGTRTDGTLTDGALTDDMARSNRRIRAIEGPRRRTCVVDRVVLAVGAPPPAVLAAATRRRPVPGLVTDPWSEGALETVRPDGDVLVLGTGLTMVDVALQLTGDGTRRVHARSRLGRLPMVHTAAGHRPWEALNVGRPVTARALLHDVHDALVAADADPSGVDWRNVVAALRREAPRLWAGLPDPERRRLLRLAGRRWDVHRHRMSPGVRRSVDELTASGRLTVGVGALVAVDRHGDHRLTATVRDRAGRREQLVVDAVVETTGPSGGAPTTPLVSALIAAGEARPHPSGPGLEVDELGGLRRDGDVRVHAVGWLRRGAEFESTAVPELRRQARALAVHFAATPVAVAGPPSVLTPVPASVSALSGDRLPDSA